MQENSTSLRLLATDGQLDVTFRPMLTAGQYSSLLPLANSTSRSADQLGEDLHKLAQCWGIACEYQRDAFSASH